MTINSIEVLVREWAIKRGLNDGTGKFKSQSFKQLAKLSEEVGELANSIIKKHPSDFEDAIGDCIVVLIILAFQNGTSIASCLDSAWNEIKDRQGKTENGIFIKDQ